MKRLLAFAFSSEASLRWGIDQVEKRFGKIPFVTDGEHRVNESSADHPHEWYCTWDALEQLNQLKTQLKITL